MVQQGSANQQPSRMRHCSKCNARHEAPTGKRCQAHSTRRGSRKATSSPQGEDGATSLEATLVALSTQIAALNSRMDNWEGNTTTPQESEVGQTLSSSSDSDEDVIQPLAELRRDQAIMRRVDRKLKKLGVVETDSDTEDTSTVSHKGKSKKSGRVRTADQVIVKYIDWPHYYVFRGLEKKPATYDTLTVNEFVYGFMKSMDKVNESKPKAAMNELLRELMNDTSYIGWENVRAIFASLMIEFEMDVLDWDMIEVIQSKRRQEVQSVKVSSDNSIGEKTSQQSIRYCGPFQVGKCGAKGDHGSERGQVQHICADCLKVTKVVARHSESECLKKTTKISKNEERSQTKSQSGSS